MELRNAITARFAINVPATLAFDYPTSAALVDFVAARIAPPSQAIAPRGSYHVASLAADTSNARLFTELVGVGCIYPNSQRGKGMDILYGHGGLACLLWMYAYFIINIID